MEQAIKECCPTFYPERWDEKIFNWDHKKFIKASVPTFFHIPLPPMIGKRVTTMMKMAEDSKKLSEDKEEILLLFNDPSAFKSDMYLSVTDTVSGAKNTTLSGTFVGKVFDGAYNAIPKFMKQMDAYLANQDKKASDYYVHYAYCPKCAKEAGHNFMVLFAKVA
ncbi:MAG: hypothetical protein HKP49_07645 [Maribacter sp.]|nr:hypothetical protein [Maribacter sp.]